MSENPILKFNSWWREVKDNLNLKHSGAVCVSTLDENGFPTARFVDLKSVDEAGFIFCTYLDSPKGRDLKRNPKISLTFWWEGFGYQIRVCGLACEIPTVVADDYWQTRSRDAQMTTLSCKQSQPLASEMELHQQFDKVRSHIGTQPVPRPETGVDFESSQR